MEKYDPAVVEISSQDERNEGRLSAGLDENEPRETERAAWSIVAIGAGLLATVIAIINCAVTAFAARREIPGTEDLITTGLSVLSHGSCGEVKRLNVGIHLVINIFATALLCCSSYCMQSISAPTRADVDKAHTKSKWLDIGIMSYRNIKFIGGSSLLCWILLFTTSLPLHLFYNSTVFVALPARTYDVLFTTTTFTEQLNVPYNKAKEIYTWPEIPQIRQSLSSYQRLSKEECIDAYGRPFVSDRGNVVVAIEPPSYYNSGGTYKGENLVVSATRTRYPERTHSDGKIYDTYDWMCSTRPSAGTCLGTAAEYCCFNNLTDLRTHADQWQPWEYSALYCLSQQIEPQCTLYANWVLLAVVAASNVIKALCIFYVAFQRRHQTLATVGDAIQSFMSTPDLSTAGMSLAGADHFRQKDWHPSSAQHPIPSKSRWYSATRRTERVWFVISWAIVTIVVFILLGIGISNASKGGGNAFSSGFGSVTSQTVITGWSIERIQSRSGRVIYAILVANLPQVVLTILYFTVNRVMTAMTMGKEWNNYASKHLPLRTSSPRGEQTRNSVLSLPLHFAIPLVLCSIILHWLVSQSIFLAAINTVDTSDSVVDLFLLATCGFSPIAIICTMVVGLVLFVAVLCVWNLKLPNRMPIVQTCSAAIAAACHDPRYVPGDETRRLRWGDIGMREEREVAEDGNAVIGRCAFSAQQVQGLDPGKRYA